MAAPTLSAKDKKQTLRPNKLKKQSLKSVWCSPYIAKWPVVAEAEETAIFDRLTSVFSEYNFTREKPPWKRGQSKEKTVSEKVSSWSPEQAAIRSHLVFGVNAVTRHLERDQLRLTLVDRSAEPAVLTNHLIMLCGTRRCPAACLPELANRTASLLGVTSLVTMGFKKQSVANTQLDDLIDFISERAPAIELPWMEQEEEEEDEEDEESAQDEKPEGGPTEPSNDSNISDQSTLLTEVEKSVIKESESVPRKIVPRLPTDLPLKIFPYKHLYVFKESTEKKDDFGSSFIQFAKDDEADTMYAKDLKNIGLTKNRKKKIIQKCQVDMNVNGDDQSSSMKKQNRKRKNSAISNSAIKKRKTDKQGNKKKRKKEKPGGKKVIYHTAVVGLMQPNPTRVAREKSKPR